MRHFRRRSSRRPGPVVQSYKQVFTGAPITRAASTDFNTVMCLGVDNYTGPSLIANEIPTGAVVKFIEIQYSAVNLVSIASFMWISIQHLRSGQSAISSRSVSGNPQRNQVHHQVLYSLGPTQNNNRTFRFKIPKKYQRIREGDTWVFARQSDTVFTESLQVIYKFYR